MGKEQKTNRLAGLIPYRISDKDNIKMLFMRPEDPNPNFNPGHKYEIAKGWIDEGESDKEAAIREGQEELGVFRGNILKMESIGEFPEKLTVFVARIKDKDDIEEPEDDETEKTKWMRPEEFTLGEAGILRQQMIIKAAVRKIKKMEGLDDDR